MNIGKKLSLVQEKIYMACKKSSRKYLSIKLIAVTKNVTEEKIKIILNEGHKEFGENRVQEACKKWKKLKKANADITLHMIGPLQTNKVKQALRIFDVIETLDRAKLAKELLKHKEKVQKFPELFVQVNLGEESNKSGCSPISAVDFINECRQLGLEITGVMGIPPLGIDPSPYFALLRNIAKRASVKTISMGMSNDFELAIYLGATHVRIGSDIFGERNA